MIAETDILAERRAVLLSLDPAVFRAYLVRHGRHVPNSDESCLLALHIARSCAHDLPDAERELSRRWIAERRTVAQG